MASDTLAAAPVHTDWALSIPEPEWRMYRIAVDAIREAGGRFLLGGAFGLACHTGRWRNTKDLDLYIRPRDLGLVASSLEGIGFRDYYPILPYDRRWIRRTVREGVIVDVIWAMANLRAEVDEVWFERARPIELRGVPLEAVPAEELIWAKLYVQQRDRCDWPDVFNLLQSVGPGLDWEHLLRRLGNDAPLLAGALSVFGWLNPARMADIQRATEVDFAALQIPGGRSDGSLRSRADLLDSRPWFIGA